MIGPITISSSTATPALIGMDNTGNTIGQAVLLEHDPAALDSSAAHFYLNCTSFPNINLPASARPDTVWTFGYNIDLNGARVDTSEPEIALHFENWYNQGGTDPNATSEWFLQFTSLDDVSHRPVGGLFYRDGTFGNFSLAGSVINFYDWSVGQRIKYDFSNPTSNIIYPVATSHSFDHNDSATLRQKNAAGTGYVTLIYLDATDTITTTTNTQVQGTLTSTGKIFGSIFSPTSATVPALGMYAPAGELGFSVAGAERLHVGITGIGIGTAAADASLTINQSGHATTVPAPAYTGLHMLGDNTHNRLFLMEAYGGTPLYMARASGGTVSAPIAVTNGAGLFNFAGQGFDGTHFITGGALNFFADENWNSSAHGSYWALRAAPIGGAFASDMFFGYGDGRWGATGAQFDGSYSCPTPSTGFSITIANACGRLILDPASTLATGTITLPAVPKDGQICNVSSSQVITALTLSPSAGQTVKGALTTLAANGFAEYTYVASDTCWYRTG